MITVTTDEKGTPVLQPQASGYLVYLDTDALIALSRGDADRRASFVRSVSSHK